MKFSIINAYPMICYIKVTLYYILVGRPIGDSSMKKRVRLFLLITVLITLVACDKNNKKMTIAAITLTKNEESIMKLLNAQDNSKIFDFTLDDTVKSIIISYHTLNKDQTWEEHGAMSGNINASSGKIGITIDDELQISLELGSKGITTTKMSITDLLNKLKNSAQCTSWLSESSIKLDKEIPLLVKAYTDSNSIIGYDTSSYSNPEELVGNDLVIAVTVCFSAVSNE